MRRLPPKLARKIVGKDVYRAIMETAKKYGEIVEFLDTGSPFSKNTLRGVIELNAYALKRAKTTPELARDGIMHEHLHDVFAKMYPELEALINTNQVLISIGTRSPFLAKMIASCATDYYNFFYLAKEVLSKEDYETFRKSEIAIANRVLKEFEKTPLAHVILWVAHASIVAEKVDDVRRMLEEKAPHLVDKFNEMVKVLKDIREPEDVPVAMLRLLRVEMGLKSWGLFNALYEFEVQRSVEKAVYGVLAAIPIIAWLAARYIAKR